MQNLDGSDYDAVAIEHSFAQFFGAPVGERGLAFDADVFRRGNHKSFAKVVENTADRLTKRLQAIKFTEAESAAGGAKCRIEGGIDRLRGITAEMKKSTDAERDDYHWLIVGSLIGCLDGLLLHLGA